MSSSDMRHLGDDPATPARLREKPSRLLAIVAAHADRLVGGGLAAADAKKWHYAVLVTLRESGPASQAMLSRRTGIYRSDLVAVINELAERGLVERTPDETDRRRNVITITEQGVDHVERLDDLLAKLHEDLLAPLTEQEREQLVTLLKRLADHHAAASRSS